MPNRRTILEEKSAKREMDQARASTNLLVTIIGENIQAKGFREDWDLANWLDGYAKLLPDMESEDAATLCRAAEALRVNILGTKLMLIASEAGEAMESLRDTGFAEILTAGNFMEELADIEIRVKDLAHMIGGDLGDEEIAKVFKNKTRPVKHGRKV